MMKPGETAAQQVARIAAHKEKFAAENAAFKLARQAENAAQDAKFAAIQDERNAISNVAGAPVNLMGLASELSRTDSVKWKNGVIVNDAC